MLRPSACLLWNLTFRIQDESGQPLVWSKEGDNYKRLLGQQQPQILQGQHVLKPRQHTRAPRAAIKQIRSLPTTPNVLATKRHTSLQIVAAAVEQLQRRRSEELGRNQLQRCGTAANNGGVLWL